MAMTDIPVIISGAWVLVALALIQCRTAVRHCAQHHAIQGGASP